METLENVFLDSTESIVMGMKGGKSWGERNLASFPASPESLAGACMRVVALGVMSERSCSASRSCAWSALSRHKQCLCFPLVLPALGASLRVLSSSLKQMLCLSTSRQAPCPPFVFLILL